MAAGSPAEGEEGRTLGQEGAAGLCHPPLQELGVEGHHRRLVQEVEECPLLGVEEGNLPPLTVEGEGDPHHLPHLVQPW